MIISHIYQLTLSLFRRPHPLFRSSDLKVVSTFNNIKVFGFSFPKKASSKHLRTLDSKSHSDPLPMTLFWFGYVISDVFSQSSGPHVLLSGLMSHTVDLL